MTVRTGEKMEDRPPAPTSPVVPHDADAPPTAAPAGPVEPPRELRYRQLFESSPLPLWVYDLETLRFLDVNEVACAKYGYTRDEFLAMTILDIRPVEDTKAVVDSVRETPASTFSSGIWRHRLKSGQIINVGIASHEMTFMGRATRFVCPIDVTSRLRAEFALRQREAGLRRAQSIARLAHFISGPDGRLEDWSEKPCWLAGVPLADLPTSLDDWTQRFVHPDDRALLRRRVADARTSCERVDVEYRLVQPDGRYIHVAQVIEVVGSGETPQERRWFNTLQDISEQKLEEERLVRQAAELEDRIQQRTAELRVSNDELQRATAAAQQASLAKSQFLSKISHELRTPLNAILGFGQLLQMAVRNGASAQQQGLYGDNIVKAGNHLLSLINELLNLASIEAGKTTMTVRRGHGRGARGLRGVHESDRGDARHPDRAAGRRSAARAGRSQPAATGAAESRRQWGEIQPGRLDDPDGLPARGCARHAHRRRRPGLGHDGGPGRRAATNRSTAWAATVATPKAPALAWWSPRALSS